MNTNTNTNIVRTCEAFSDSCPSLTTFSKPCVSEKSDSNTINFVEGQKYNSITVDVTVVAALIVVAFLSLL